MNAARLKEIVEFLLSQENQSRIQKRLNAVSQQLSNLASNPQQSEAQTQFANALSELDKAMVQTIDNIQPAQAKLIEEIGGSPFFLENLATTIAKWTAENPIAPAVTQKKVADLTARRAEFIETITQLRDRLTKLNIQTAVLDSGTAEIGFLLPRELFHNHLDELIKELGVLNKIMRAFTEIATGTISPIEVRQISTSDPLFFFGLDATTIAMIGGVVTWALMQWKMVEDIRKLRSEAKKNSVFTEKEIKGFFDAKIQESIDKGIDHKVNELLRSSKDKLDGPRQSEKKNELAWALRSILARVERGMTVEIRFLPPATTTQEEGDQEPREKNDFGELSQIVPQLVFPSAEQSPVLELPPPEPQQSPSTRPQTTN